MSLFLNDITIEHQIRPHLKHAYLKVKDDATVVLRSNGRSLRDLHDFVKSKERWIVQQQRLVSRLPKITIGSDVLLFSELKELNQLSYGGRMMCDKDYNRFYNTVAKEYLDSRVELFADQMELKYSGIKYKKMRRRWGSCSAKALLTFNTLLVQLREDLIDYIVVHELAHIVHFNHSASFHLLVREHLPNELDLRGELRELRCVLY